MGRKGKDVEEGIAPGSDMEDIQRKKAELEVSSREAEVQKKWSEAEIVAARAHKVKREAGIEEEEEVEDEMEASGGVVRDKYLSIWRQPPGSGWKLLRRSVSLDEIGDVKDFIDNEGMPEDNHLVRYLGSNGKPIGKKLFFPAREESEGDTSKEKKKRIRDLERMIANKADDDRIAKLEKIYGIGKDEEKPKDVQKDSWMEMLKVLIPVLVAWIQKPAERSPIEPLLPLLISSSHSGQMTPKDMIGMFAPFVVEMSKASSESNKVILGAMSEMDQSFRERMLDLVMSDPNKTQDEIDRWQKWLTFGETALRKSAGVVRDGLKNLVGSDGKQTKKIEQKKPPPGLPAPEKEKGKSEEPSSESKPEDAAQTQADPSQSANILKAKRVEGFLLAAEEEMNAESDPVLMAEKCEELYLTLPKKIRTQIEDAMSDDPIQETKVFSLFSTLKDLCPDVTERLAQAIQSDEEKQTWLREFLSACAFDDEPEEGEEGPEPPNPEEKKE